MSIWQGALVRLRAIEPDDWEAYFQFDQDDEQARRLYFVPFPRSRERLRRWAERESTLERDGDDMRFVIETLSGEVVGDLTTHHCDPRVGKFSYGINISAPHRRKGYATDAINVVLRYYFHELRYQKVTVGIYSFNTESIRLHERLGFQLEGRLRRTAYTNGAYADELMYGMTVEEWAARCDRVES